ncbi:MAG: TolC family protein [Haliscomenobacter sp.]|nr:TolC family protein [Haliscomenobacter sp.]
MPKSFPLLLLSAVVFSQISAQTRSLTLKEAIALAQEQSVAARLAENVRENRAFAYQTFLAGLKPQLSFQAGLPTYSRDFFEVRQDDGSVRYLSRTQNIAQAGFSLFQVIPLTGGTVSVNTDFTRFDDFDKKYSSYNGTPVNIEWRQPLFAFNPYKWSRKIEPLKMQEAQKTYKFQMEDIAQRTVLLFFSVLDAQEEVRIATLNLENNRQIKAIEERRIELGTTTREKLLQIELQVLRATQSLQEANADLRNARLNFQAFLGIQDNQSIGAQIPEEGAALRIDPDQALQQARENRSEYIAFERQRLESTRDVEEARLSRNQATLRASLGFNGAGENVGDIFNPLTDQERLSVGITVPVLDWGRSKARQGIAAANEKVTAYNIEQEEINLRTEIVNQVNTLELLRESIRFARQTTAIAEERYQLALEQYQIGKLTVTDLNIALSEKDASSRTYLSALRRYWEAYYRLRQMTLYDYELGQKL